MRCLTLAHELKKQNVTIFFLSKDHTGNINSIIEENFKLHILSGGVKTPLSTSDYSKWLGGTVQEDALSTNDFLKSIGGCDLLVIDHYALNSDYEKSIEAKNIMVIDDLANRTHKCNLLLDQNITASNEKYRSLLEGEAKLLLGPKYALLRNEFKDLRAKVNTLQFDRPVKKIVVFFGGSDADGLTLKLAKALGEVLKQYEFHFVLSDSHRDYGSLSKMLSRYPESYIHPFLKNFGELMLTADLFIGAGGTTSWERAALGGASAVVAVAENQVGNCQELHKNEVCYSLGRPGDLTGTVLQNFFSKIVPDQSLWYRYRKNSYALVDALGKERVVKEIETILC